MNVTAILIRHTEGLFCASGNRSACTEELDQLKRILGRFVNGYVSGDGCQQLDVQRFMVQGYANRNRIVNSGIRVNNNRSFLTLILFNILSNCKI